VKGKLPETGMVKQQQLKGLASYLGMIRRYWEMFQSRTCALERRIESAAYVSTYLLLWQGWAKQFAPEYNALSATERELTADEVYISQEAKVDVLLSCHFVVLLIKVFRDEFSHLPIPFWKLGSDVCEDLFSSLGSFVMNKRTYTVCEAVQTLRTKLRVSLAGYTHGIKPGKRRGGRRTPFDEETAHAGNQLKYPTDDEIARAWRRGVAQARKELESLGLKPASGRLGWWKAPHMQMQDPKKDPAQWLEAARAGTYYAAGRSEEDIIEENSIEQPGHDAGRAGDDQAYNADHDSDGDETAVVPEGGEEAQLVREAEAAEDAEDAAAVVAGVEMLLDNAVAAGQGGAPCRIAVSMEVPGLGQVSKHKICSWFSTGTENLSADRGTRAQQAGNGSTIASHFSVKEDAWTVQLGKDLAVKFEDEIYIGRVNRIRRRYRSSGRQQWADYIYPFGLQEARTDELDIYFDMAWYQKVKGRVNKGKYTFGGAADTREVKLESIVCPVALDGPEAAGNKIIFRLPQDQQDVIDACQAGQLDWD
jgi:hypothetical protein